MAAKTRVFNGSTTIVSLSVQCRHWSKEGVIPTARVRYIYDTYNCILSTILHICDARVAQRWCSVRLTPHRSVPENMTADSTRPARDTPLRETRRFSASYPVEKHAQCHLPADVFTVTLGRSIDLGALFGQEGGRRAPEGQRQIADVFSTTEG